MKPGPTISFAFALALTTLSLGTAYADGPYDGTWSFDATASGRVQSTGRNQCLPIHLTLTITNGQISGSIETTANNGQVSDGFDSNATPVTGTIDRDGHVTMKWGDRVATGTATRRGMEVSWDGDCGERVADGHPEY